MSAPQNTTERLVAEADGDFDKLVQLFLESGIHGSEEEARLEASLWINGYGDVIPRD